MCIRDRTGLKHGTVTLLIDHEPYEVTTFRVDGNYTDGRHPDSVAFTTNIRDLSLIHIFCRSCKNTAKCRLSLCTL